LYRHTSKTWTTSIGDKQAPGTWFLIHLQSKMLPATRATGLFSLPSTIRPILATRLYATHTGLGTTSSPSQPRRKAVTTFNDDGRVAWKDLSSRERVARTTQQTFNLGTVLVGAILTVRTLAKMSLSHNMPVLILAHREGLSISFIQKYFLPKVRLVISTEQQTKSRTIRDARRY
jgi:hypothetical protein